MIKNKLKKTAATLLLCTLALPAAAFAQSDSMMSMDPFKDAPMMKKGSTEYVEVRTLAKNLGCDLAWDQKTHTVTVMCSNKMGMSDSMMKDNAMKDNTMSDSMMKDNSMSDGMMKDNTMGDSTMKDNTMSDSMMKSGMLSAKFMIGSKTASIDGMEKMLMAAPMISHGRTYLNQADLQMYIVSMLQK